jgi:hypothetical protein
MSTHPTEKIVDLYTDLDSPTSLKRAATAPSKPAIPGLRIRVQQIPDDRNISDATPRKAPVPPNTAPLITRTISDATPRKSPLPPTGMSRATSMKSSSSQRGLKDKVKKEEMEMFLMKVRTENAAATSDDVAVLKKQVQALEAKVDELQLIVRV